LQNHTKFNYSLQFYMGPPVKIFEKTTCIIKEQLGEKSSHVLFFIFSNQICQNFILQCFLKLRKKSLWKWRYVSAHLITFQFHSIVVSLSLSDINVHERACPSFGTYRVKLKLIIKFTAGFTCYLYFYRKHVNCSWNLK